MKTMTNETKEQEEKKHIFVTLSSNLDEFITLANQASNQASELRQTIKKMNEFQIKIQPE